MLAYSPNLSLATAVFELGAAAWALNSPGRPAVLRTTAAILIFLAGYQLLEVLVCGQPGESLWPRLAYADVIWLPALGCSLVVRLARPRSPHWRTASQVGLVVAGGFALWVFVDPLFVTGSVCQAVIAAYTNPSSAYELYGAAYHIGLGGMMFGGVAAMTHVADPVDRAHLGDVVMGTVGFVVPSLLTQVLVPEAVDAMPSVMCHYALVLGVLLARLVARERRAALAGEVHVGQRLANG